MKDKRCLICKYLGVEHHYDVSMSTMFHLGGSEYRIPLCRNHSVELFREGQYRFVRKYKDISKDFMGTDQDEEFLNYAKKLAQSDFRVA